MSYPLEQIIRPFTDQSSSPVLGTGTIPQLSQNITLVVVGNGAIKSGNYSYSYSIDKYADAVQTEQTS
jgi:hypothetical protein